METDRKALVRLYKETPRPAGIYRIRNEAAQRSLVRSTPDLQGILNRQRFQLEHGSHPSKDLQRDWHELGPDAFVFETLDELKPKADSKVDPASELRVLLELWVEKLTAAGESFYRSF